MTKSIDLDALEALREAGTPGRWEAELGITHAIGGYRQGFPIMAEGEELNGRRAILNTVGFHNIPQERANAILLAAAVNDLTPMIAELRRLREENKTLTALCDTASDAAYDLARLAGVETKGIVYGELIALLPETVQQLKATRRTCREKKEGG